MSGILTDATITKMIAVYYGGGGVRDSVEDRMRAALKAVLPLIVEAIAKKLSERDANEYGDDAGFSLAAANAVRTLTASVEK